MYIYKFGSSGHTHFARWHNRYMRLILFQNLQPRHYEITQAPLLW